MIHWYILQCPVNRHPQILALPRFPQPQRSEPQRSSFQCVPNALTIRPGEANTVLVPDVAANTRFCFEWTVVAITGAVLIYFWIVHSATSGEPKPYHTPPSWRVVISKRGEEGFRESFVLPYEIAWNYPYLLAANTQYNICVYNDSSLIGSFWTGKQK